ncbi:putative methyltransferase-domain-containing protein [Kockovaella imperatae]|uniref:Protein-lysine N-methyltransferase EFM6 n=1 Tax=Kockovaella imperatae TaxID=4999 RepID=A0A1Y1UU73_9TREE|nr:putative methyltransferase-domain-containing protein [Kockovaella imperatae]ORX41187.1 putative methyltransferase-domain-containing protein [Kockovaella imperatae]
MLFIKTALIAVQGELMEFPRDRRPASPSADSVTSIESVGAANALSGLAPPREPTTVEGSESIINVSKQLGKEVRLKVDAGPGCGGIAWPSGEVLSQYIGYRYECDPSYLKGKKILELGSGTGLVGIAAGILEPTAEIWVTDQKQLLDLMERNVEYNGVSSNVHVDELNWGEQIPGHIPVNDLDMILAADCVYFEPAFPLLVQTLCDLIPIGKDIEMLFCWKKRRKADKRFFALLKKHFHSEHIEDARPGAKEQYSRDGVSLLQLRRIK